MAYDEECRQCPIYGVITNNPFFVSDIRNVRWLYAWTIPTRIWFTRWSPNAWCPNNWRPKDNSPYEAEVLIDLSLTDNCPNGTEFCLRLNFEWDRFPNILSLNDIRPVETFVWIKRFSDWSLNAQSPIPLRLDNHSLNQTEIWMDWSLNRSMSEVLKYERPQFELDWSQNGTEVWIPFVWVGLKSEFHLQMGLKSEILSFLYCGLD